MIEFIMVKIELRKRDFVWVGLIIVLMFVGLGYAYGGNNPPTMGHSGSEIELSGNTVVDNAFCQKITGNNCGATVVAPYCGDGSCNNGETCSSCSGDCGACVNPGYCGDGNCDSWETCSSCPDCGPCDVEPKPCWSSGTALCALNSCAFGYGPCWSGGCADPSAGNCCSGTYSTSRTNPTGDSTDRGYNWCD